MDNIQIAIFLEKYYILIRKALGDLYDNLPDEIGTDRGDEGVSYWQAVELEDFLDMLERDIKTLKDN